MPVGFKNSTDGDIQIAINAILSARHSHSFVGIDATGSTSILRTTGNPDCHLILRGGRSGPNYHPDDIENACQLLEKAGIEPTIIVDASHGNSMKKSELQIQVVTSLMDQKTIKQKYAQAIVGFMLESNLEEGSQPIGEDKAQIKPGISVTDPSLGWDDTEQLLLDVSGRIKAMQ
jgi:3-deoxy-7-phosphoheptulonate synthase